MLVAGRAPDHITRLNLLDWTTRTLRETRAGRDDQNLAQRMCVPGRARARFEGDAAANAARGLARLKQRIDPDRELKYSAGTLYQTPC
jgi:hypothetical protein